MVNNCFYAILCGMFTTLPVLSFQIVQTRYFASKTFSSPLFSTLRKNDFQLSSSSESFSDVSGNDTAINEIRDKIFMGDNTVSIESAKDDVTALDSAKDDATALELSDNTETIDDVNSVAVSDNKDETVVPSLQNVVPSLLNKIKSVLSGNGLKGSMNKESLSKLGLNVLLAYGFVSNASYITCLILAWVTHGKNTGLSPLVAGQW
eukprot:CAMPEP_0119033454 /NCGR_PEP_ID=MMETSP1177-20130426/498_1 /TAXON_ID=2985 /ORGANISM="Ochromonas sp, Strain CCMP1899" /LENGTH=205 /DNA_ID=CAMNT_0006990211 /DNA_START=85 /DNA_END=699 /DNA_ORIENTATION=+